MISYGSRATNPNQQNYGSTKLELLAVLFGLKKFRPYLYGTRFLLVTDHRALLWLANTPQPPALLARWILRLQEFEFKIQHRPGKAHQNADALSRKPFCSASIAVNVIGQTKNLEGFTNAQLQALQRRDPPLKPFFDFLEKQIVPEDINRKQYIIRDYSTSIEKLFETKTPLESRVAT